MPCSKRLAHILRVHDFYVPVFMIFILLDLMGCIQWLYSLVRETGKDRLQVSYAIV